MRIFTVATIIAAFALPASSSEYRPPDYYSCGTDLISAQFGDEERCINLSGRTQAMLGSDSKSGIVHGLSFQGRAAAIFSGRASAVLGLKAERRYELGDYVVDGAITEFDIDGEAASLVVASPQFTESRYVNEAWINEAFVSLGSDVTIRAGLIDASFDSLATQRLEHFAILSSFLESPSPPFNDTRAAVEARWGVSRDLKSGLAIENSGHSLRGIVRLDAPIGNATSHNLLVTTYDQGSQSHLIKTDLLFENGSGITATGRVGSGIADTGGGLSRGSNLLQGGIRFPIGPVMLATLGGLTDSGREIILAASVGDTEWGPSASVAVQKMVDVGHETAERQELGLSYAFEDIKLSGWVGGIDGDLSPYIIYGRARIEWDFANDRSEAVLDAYANSDGGLKGTLKLATEVR